MLSRTSGGPSLLEDAFLTFKSNLELDDSFGQIIQRKHNAVRSVIENARRGTKTQLIGSLQRRTRINPRPDDTFDLDILVILGKFSAWVTGGGITPQAALSEMRRIIGKSERYDSLGPTIDQPTVSFEYQDNVKVELVPAFLDNIGARSDGATYSPVGRGYWIPKNGGWELVDYDYEADYLVKQNAIADNWLVPIIKMLKAAKRQYFPDMPSFYLEILATHMIPIMVAYYKEHDIAFSYSTLITAFFTHVENRMGAPQKMPGSNSFGIDIAQSQKPQVISTLRKIKVHCEHVNQLNSDSAKTKEWRKLFGEPFPSY